MVVLLVQFTLLSTMLGPKVFRRLMCCFCCVILIACIVYGLPLMESSFKVRLPAGFLTRSDDPVCIHSGVLTPSLLHASVVSPLPFFGGTIRAALAVVKSWCVFLCARARAQIVMDFIDLPHPLNLIALGLIGAIVLCCCCLCCYCCFVCKRACAKLKGKKNKEEEDGEKKGAGKPDGKSKPK
jgi:hypothetical protein